MGWGLGGWGGAQGGLSDGAARAASEPSLFHAQAKNEGSYVNIWDYLSIIHLTAFHTCAPESLRIRSHVRTDVSFKGEAAPRA